jgi:hypothetical protein
MSNSAMDLAWLAVLAAKLGVSTFSMASCIAAHRFGLRASSWNVSNAHSEHADHIDCNDLFQLSLTFHSSEQNSEMMLH